MRKACCIFFCLWCMKGMAQIPVEWFAGHQKSTLDLMFFTYFKKKNKEPGPFLIFNRNRLSIDYRMTKTEYLPQFAATEAISYNRPGWAGFAPVVVLQAFNSGISPKTGVQYARITSDMTVFSWLVCEWKTDPYVDFFMLLRYTPTISKQLRLFTQAEIFNAIPTASSKNFRWFTRLRLGVHINRFQVGVGTDLSGAADATGSFAHNTGLFTRYIF